MKKVKLLLLVGILSFLFGESSNAQVTQTEFQVRYDTTECRWDAYVILKTGSAIQGVAASRVIIGSQYSIVTEADIFIDVVANFQPRTSGGNGTPATWTATTSKNAPAATPLKSYHGVTNSISPTTLFATATQGDSIHLFSFLLKDLNDGSTVDYSCNEIEVRPFESSTDPGSTAPGMDGQNYNCGFTFLLPGQTYFGNLPTVYPAAPQLSAEVVCSDNLNIDLTAITSTCQSPLEYMWSGPSYSGTTEDVLISPATNANNGTYSVTVTDAFNCSSELTIEAFIRADAGPDQTACPGGSITLTGTDPSTGTWTSDPNNAVGSTLTDDGNGMATVELDPTATGTYLFFYSVLDCPDTVAVTVGNPDAGPDPADVSCFSSGSADLNATGTGTWTVGASSPGTANFSDPSSPTATVSGFSTPGVYELLWSIGGCSDMVTVNVSDECSCTATDNIITPPSVVDFCGNSGAILLDGMAAGPAPGTYVWEYSLNSTAFSNAPGTNDQEDYTTQDLTEGNHAFRRIYIFTDGMPCQDTSNVITITVSDAPVLGGGNVVGTSPTQCGVSDGIITISGLDPNTDYDLTYSINGSTQTDNITTDGSGQYQLTSLGQGTYADFFVVGTNGCPSNVFAGPIELTEPGSPGAPTVSANPNPVCLGDQINLTASGQAGATYNWSASSNDAGLGNSTSTNNSMTATLAGNYTIFVTQTINGCTSGNGTVSVTINTVPPDFVIDDITPINPTACGGSDGQIQISGFDPNIAYTLEYTKNGVGTSASIFSDGSGTIILTGLTSGSYGDFTVSSGIGCSSNTVVGPVLLMEPNAPSIPVGLTAAPSPACVGETINLSVEPVSGIIYVWSVTPTGGGLVASGSNMTTMVPTLPGTYTISVKATSNGCESSPVTTTVTVDPSPATPTIGMITTSNPTTCGGTDGQITIGGYSPGTTYDVTYTFAGSPVTLMLSANGTGTLFITNLAAGNYSNFSIASANGCSSGVFVGPVSLSELGAPGAPENLRAKPNPGCLGETIELSVNNSPGAVFTWAASDDAAGLGNSTGATNSMLPTSPGLYTISVFQTVNGCTSPAARINVYVRSICVNPDFGVTYQDIELTGDLSTNDGQIGYDYSNIVAAPSNPLSCLPSVNKAGQYTFTCAAIGEYSYTVEVCRTGQRVVCETMPLVITVLEPLSPSNAPVANHDYIATSQDNEVVINVTANDKCQSQPNCSLTNPQLVTPPVNGSWNAGTSTYTPNSGFSGRDSFRYEVCQNPSVNPVNCDQEWVYINVYATDVEVFTNGMDDYNQTYINTPLTANVSQGVSANDRDPADEIQSVRAFNANVAGKGSLVMNTNGSYTFTPATDYVGPVDFAYQVCRSNEPTVCDSATLHLLVDPQLPLGVIGDFVWEDINGDGIQSNNEPGIPFVLVKLYNYAGIVENTTMTDAQGKYLFENVFQGDYFIEFVMGSEYTPTFANIGNDTRDSDVTGANGTNTTATFTVAGGDVNLTIDGGYYRCSKIGDNVWYDFNENDIYDSYENGINGLKVNLYKRVNNTWVLWETQKTDGKPGSPSDDGWYEFCVAPGTYYVEVIQPTYGLVFVRPFRGNDPFRDSDIDNTNGFGTTRSFTLQSGQDKLDIGAGFYPMVQMGNLVWVDVNNNGVQDPDEARVPGVKVEAFDAVTDEKLGEDITDTDGTYNIDYLVPRDIYLKFEAPAGYVATSARTTTDDMDSDVDHSNGYNTTRTFSTNPGDDLVNIDLGLANGILPVEWSTIFAEGKDGSNLVHWETTSEINVQEYIVERKLDTELSYSQISTDRITSKNTNNNIYEFTDADVSYSGVYNYRIKQIDFDGNYDYSKEVAVRRFSDDEVVIYPNPAKDFVKISYAVEVGEDVRVQIYGIDGKIVMDKTSTSKSNNTMIDQIDLSQLEAGVYNITLTLGNKTIHEKIVKL